MKSFLYLIIAVMPLSGALYSPVTWHSAPYQYEDLLRKDLELLEALEQGISEEIDELSEYQAKITKQYENTKSRLSQDFQHPVSYFRSKNIWDTSQDIKSVGKLDDFLLDYNLIEWPWVTDKKAVLQNLYSLQKSHDLKTEDLANGIICESQDHKMSVDECMNMATYAYNDNNIVLEAKWYQQAMKKQANGEKGRYSMGDVSLALKKLNLQKTCDEMCKQDQEILNKDLKCQLWDNFDDPWMILQPVKMEMLETEPFVYRFYDVISDEEISELKDLAWRKLVHATTQGEKRDAVVTIKNSRVAHNYFYRDDEDDLIGILKRRIARITGFNVDTFEDLQIATYGIGGHYSVHPDADNKGEWDTRRAATFMFYLSDVENGGATVFVHPRIAVKPQKGSAIFWYNLLPSGLLDENTYHCACPILVGNKWIVNQWIMQGTTGVCTDQKGIGRFKT